MKINNWCRKLSAALVAGGLLAPCSVYAAGLGVNLVTNGDFENVNVNITGDYAGPLVLNWTGPNLYAYSHNDSVTSTSGPGGVPDYANGAVDPPSPGNWYLSTNNGGPTLLDVHDPDVYYQDIDVSTGATAVKIATGTATYNLSAYMSSYVSDGDFGNVRVQFRNAANAPLDVGQISDTADDGPQINFWNLTSTTGNVPVGTASVRMSLFGTKIGGSITGGADGYMDNIDFRIVPEPSSVILAGLGMGAAVLRRRRRDS